MTAHTMSTRTAISHRPSLHTPFASPIPRTRPIHIPPPNCHAQRRRRPRHALGGPPLWPKGPGGPRAWRVEATHRRSVAGAVSSPARRVCRPSGANDHTSVSLLLHYHVLRCRTVTYVLPPGPPFQWQQEGDDQEVARLRPLLARTQLEKLPLRYVAVCMHAVHCMHLEQAGVRRRPLWMVCSGISPGSGFLWGCTSGGDHPRRCPVWWIQPQGLLRCTVPPVVHVWWGCCADHRHLQGWIGIGESRDSMAAFLFTWPMGFKAPAPGGPPTTAIKLQKVGGAALAVVDQPASGPQFGPEGVLC